MEIIYLALTIWFGYWLFKHAPSGESINKPIEDINLYVEKIENPKGNTLLVYEEGSNSFICQAQTEKELHTKLFEIYHGQPIDLRYDEDKAVRLSFEVFVKPKA